MRAQPNANPGRNRRVTITDLSRELGLTKGTVSRALNGYTDISESTRLRVSRMAERMGYRPLSHAQAIRTGRVRSIGLVLQVNQHDGHRPFLADFLAGISETASRLNWTMTVATASSEPETLETLQRLVDERKADGFILPRTYLDDPRVDYLRKAGVPFILYGRTEDPTGCAWYDIKSEQAMTDAVTKLARLGHQRIAFVQGGAGLTYARLRLQGYRAGLELAGLDFDPDLVGPAALNRVDGGAVADSLLRLPQPPTAIIYAVDRAALGAFPIIESHGLRVGCDVSIISYDGIPEGALMRPQLSTFSVDTRAAGGRLTELLIDIIRGAQAETLRELGVATFQDRASHGTPAISSSELRARICATGIN